MRKTGLFFCCMFFLQLAPAQDEARLLRFPAIHGNQVVFSYAGDLYTVSRSGGIARRLTSSDGYEMFAKFSPDGNVIAFTGQYDGNTEVFTIPSTGGEPKRLTYTATLGRDDIGDRMGPNNIVMAWTPDGKDIIYRSRRYSFNDFRGQLFSVPVNGGLSGEIPLMNGGFCSYAPDGKKLAFNRVFREFRTWKYYKGGMADDIWIYDFDTKAVTDITNNLAQDIEPMWHGNEIYFLSDRDRTMNLFAYDLNTKETQKVTNFTDYDIKFPSLGDDAIIFEKGGYLYLYEFATKEVRKLTIQISNEIPSARNGYVDASKGIKTWDLSPDGERVVLGARGEVFTLPAKEGITRNLTQSSGVHERDVAWSPDGKYIAYFSDKTGEFEIYIQSQDQSQPAVQLTRNDDTYPYDLRWSPDSKKILWNDEKFRLQYVDVATQAVTLVDQSESGAINDFNWSPDSKWITYSNSAVNVFNRVILYNVAGKTKSEVTDGWYQSYQPVFSNDGKYLFFVSARTYDPIYSNTEWNHAYQNMEKIYMVMLSKSTKSPFAPTDNVVKVAEPEAKPAVPSKSGKDAAKDKTAAKDETSKVADVKIDLDGIQDRIVEMPVKASNYGDLVCLGSKVYYIERSAEAGQTSMKIFDLEKKEEKDLGTGIDFKVSADGKKMLVRKAGSFGVIDIPAGPVELKDFVDLSNMKVWVDYAGEWKQVFNESWRQMRDFFYSPTMNGVDWPAMKDKYAALLPYVKHRDDLTYIIGEMIGELNIGHAYVLSGEKPKAERIQTGLLGAKLSRDASGYYKVDNILEGANWSKELRSPLTEVGVNVSKGDYILAVNGNSTNTMTDIYAGLVGMADKDVELTVNSKPDMAGSRKVIIVPIASEASLYYYNWVQNNIRKVSEATNGEVGYIHIPDMGTEGLNEFIKHYYPQIMKKGLIIDDRGNGGGNVSPMIIERLIREMVMINVARNQTKGTQNPEGAFVGPKVLLIDNYSASDGDIFPYRFKTLNMGKVIGVRSWGGVTGIRGPLPLIDGGQLYKPEFASYSVDGKSWPIEGHGVDPDIVVDNNPALEYLGEDAQLNKAIETVKEEMKDYNKYITPVPPYPDRTK
jgi:tricorn protease